MAVFLLALLLLLLESDYVAGLRVDAWILCNRTKELTIGDHEAAPIPGCTVRVATGLETSLSAATYRDGRGEFSGLTTLSDTGLQCRAVISHARLPDRWIHVGFKITYVTPSGKQMHAYVHSNYWYYTDLRDDEPYESADVWFETRVHLQPRSVVSPSVHNYRHRPPFSISPISFSLFDCVPIRGLWPPTDSLVPKEGHLVR